MASDDALAQGQGRKRWFGGRGPTRAAEKSPESDMTPGQPPIPETSVQTEGMPDVRQDDLRNDVAARDDHVDFGAAFRQDFGNRPGVRVV